MPELPEVENIVRDLRKRILSKKISKVHILLSKIIRNKKNYFIKEVENSIIKNVFRRGKFIIIELSANKYLVIHLKLSGRLLYLSSDEPLEKHTHLTCEFKNSNMQLRYQDVRQFGYLKVIHKSELEDFLSNRIGPDYLSVLFQEFASALKSRKRIIKSLLLDQKVFSGLGNIYVTEALYQAKINPKAISSNIKAIKIKKLYNSIQSILKEAIRLKGSSVDDYIRPDRSEGRYQKIHKVYQKEGKKCPRCRTIIKRIKMNGRSSYFCPKCQKL